MNNDDIIKTINILSDENNSLKNDINFFWNENNCLKNENNFLKNEISKLKELQKCNDDTKDTHNKFSLITYKPTKYSYSKEYTLNIINNIKTIDDIINLSGLWHHIKHNYILQKLYHLIEPLSLLNKMIGLYDIKKDIYKKIIYYVMNPFKDEYLHTIISGPAGVGKTEFAKIYADIFVHLGILKNDKFIQIKRSDLIGQFLGQTTHKTKEILDSAMGGVLFLDEAYSLGNNNKSDSYSKEAIDIINQYLSERKGDFMFIIAGYEDDLDNCLFSYNQGLRRRFQSHYNITGYNASELKEIFKSMVNKTKFNVNDISNDNLDKFFSNNIIKFKHYAGDIELLFNEIKYCQSLRAFNNNIKNKNIILKDIEIALENIQKNKKSNEPPFGMYC
jgi:AAA+ superfamily predicted ATPase/regulator of replication initiation timing